MLEPQCRPLACALAFGSGLGSNPALLQQSGRLTALLLYIDYSFPSLFLPCL
jgi:hypothetical protein